MAEGSYPVLLRPDEVVDAERGETDQYSENGHWYEAPSGSARLVYSCPKDVLRNGKYFSFRHLHDGRYNADYHIKFFTEERSRIASLLPGSSSRDEQMSLKVSFVPQCEDQFTLPLDAMQGEGVSESQYRDNSRLRTFVGKRPRDFENINSLTVEVRSQAGEPIRWFQTPIRVSKSVPAPLENPSFPEGPLVDEMGQSTLHAWSGRTESQEALSDRLRGQLNEATEPTTRSNRSRWGGRAGEQLDETGFFRTHHDGERWWLVDPDGHPFWSSGVCSVQPVVKSAHQGIEGAFEWLPSEDQYDSVYDKRNSQPYVNFLKLNFLRTFGADEWYDAWATITASKFRELGFNTMGMWSDDRFASDYGFPYLRVLEFDFPRTPTIYKDFPDVYHDEFVADARAIAATLERTAEDPAMVGYVLGQYHDWSLDRRLPAVEMLRKTETAQSRHELVQFLEEKYDDGVELEDEWNMDVDLDDVARGVWTQDLTDEAEADLREFSWQMVDHMYEVITDECEKVDDNHLCFGTNYNNLPHKWAWSQFKHVDVVCSFIYSDNPSESGFNESLAACSERFGVPVLVSEYHFGAFDMGLPSAGLCPVDDQTARAEAFRTYLEDAAAKPWCVGAHYFKLYDQSLVGDPKGENFNIGFLDVCNRPYDPLCKAASSCHDELYDLVGGQ